MVAVALVAVDLAALRYATAPWNSGQPLRQPLVNILPMANALVVAGYRVASPGDRPRHFATGFFVGGLAALLLHSVFDLAYPWVMWATCDWLANNSPGLSPFLGEWLTTYTVPGRGSFFRLYPAFALVVCLPEFAVAWASGSTAWAWLPNRRVPGLSSSTSTA
jgi:hypothetical protein